MEFGRLVEQRCSVRQFRPDPVRPEDLREMVRIAGLAPSPHNAQPWRFIAITDRSLLARMAEAVKSKLAALIPVPQDEEKRRSRSRVEWFSTFFGGAPAVVAATLGPYRAVIDDALAGTSLSHDAVNELRMHPDVQCLGAAVEHLVLAATDLGYGACWLSGPLIAREELERILGVASPWRLAALVALGRPAASHDHTQDRKPLDEIFELRD
jgi:nitroreductase